VHRYRTCFTSSRSQDTCSCFGDGEEYSAGREGENVGFKPQERGQKVTNEHGDKNDYANQKIGIIRNHAGRLGKRLGVETAGQDRGETVTATRLVPSQKAEMWPKQTGIPARFWLHSLRRWTPTFKEANYGFSADLSFSTHNQIPELWGEWCLATLVAK
jgi:hypothetical protein